MNFNETMPFFLAQLATLTKGVMETELQETNLHSGQIFILFELWKHDGVSQIELSRALNVSAPTINKMVKSLQRNGFITSDGCKTDGRVMRVYLTQFGISIKPRIEEIWKNIETKIVENLTITEQMILKQLFEKINKTLKKD